MKTNPRTLFVSLLSVLSSFAPAAEMAKVSVDAGVVYELAVDGDANQKASYNTDGTSLVLGSGATVRLVGAENGAGAVFTMRAAIYCASGSCTIDGRGLVDYADTLVVNGCVYCPNGAVTVKGFKKVVFSGMASGPGQGGSTTATVALRTRDILFDPVDAAANELVFSNNVAMVQALQTCRWSIAPGALFWPVPDDTFCTEDGTDVFCPDGWTLGLVNAKSVGNGTVRVPDGGFLPFRHCRINFASGRMGNWSPDGTNFIVRNIVLEGASSRFECWDNLPGACGVVGEVSGAGQVLFTAQSNNGVTFKLDGRASYTGPTTLKGNSSAVGNHMIVFTDPQPETSCLAFEAIRLGTFGFQPAGCGQQPTAVSLKSVRGVNSSANVLAVEPLQTVTIASVSGSLAFAGPSSGQVVIERLEDGAAIRLRDGVRLQVKSVGTGTKVILGDATDAAPGEWFIAGPDAAPAVELNVLEQVPGGRIRYGGNLVLWKTWQDRLVLWTDASVADSIVYLRGVNADATSVDETGVLWWYDRRPDRRTNNDYAWAQSRFPTNDTANVNKYKQLYPLHQAGILNGRSAVSCGSPAATAQTRLGALRPGTTLNNQLKSSFSRIPTEYAIIVARNTKTSLGSALLSTTNGCLAASKKGCNGAIFTNAQVTVYRDGTRVEDPAATTWGQSEWHVYSFTTAGARVNGLTTADDPHDSAQGGGFDYAEIMLFSDVPGEIERRVIEEELSEKWGIPVSHAGTVVARTLDLAVPASPSAEPVLTPARAGLSYDLTVNLAFDSGTEGGDYPLVKDSDIRSVAVGAVQGLDAGLKLSVRLDAATGTVFAHVASTGTIVIAR